MSRHLYDLGKMMETEIAEAAIIDKQLYNTLIRHREAYIRISWMDYTTLQPEKISFVPPAEIMDAYKKDYQMMQEQMIYGEAEKFDDLIYKLKDLQLRFRKR